MMGLMVLAVCSVPPLAILVVALSGLSTGRFAVALPVVVSAGVLLMPLFSPAFTAPDQTSKLRFVPQLQIGVDYASLRLPQ